jgi:hypothetical protein
LIIGETISHYRVLALLGAGGMGEVYKAEDTRLKRAVALKFLPLALVQDRDAKQRLLLEAQAASALDHPNICTIHEIDESADGRVFLAMAYYDGETLKTRIDRGAVSIDEAIDIIVTRRSRARPPARLRRASRSLAKESHLKAWWQFPAASRRSRRAIRFEFRHFSSTATKSRTNTSNASSMPAATARLVTGSSRS